MDLLVTHVDPFQSLGGHLLGAGVVHESPGLEVEGFERFVPSTAAVDVDVFETDDGVAGADINAGCSDHGLNDDARSWNNERE